ncbi:MAG: peptidoglycan-binding domain-containing protein [Pseudomonadota bacterium]
MSRPTCGAAAALACMALAGCENGVMPASNLPGRVAVVPAETVFPAEAPADTCWAREVMPAVIDTITEQIMIRPARVAADGAVTSPAAFRTESRQKIVQDRREVIFETPCPAQMTQERIAALQRALQARGYLTGPITGGLDARTLRATRAFQEPRGLASATLSLETARRLGLIAYPRQVTTE